MSKSATAMALLFLFLHNNCLINTVRCSSVHTSFISLHSCDVKQALKVSFVIDFLFQQMVNLWYCHIVC